jgi:tetratricopeptide (TPR) repeat protein
VEEDAVKALAPLLAVAALAAAQGADAWQASYREGIEAYGVKKDFRAAAARFEVCHKIAPHDWHGHFWHALCLAQLALQTQDPDERQRLLAEARRRTELMVANANVPYTSPATLYLEGMIAHIGGDHPRAYERLDKAIRAPAQAYAPFAEVQLLENVRTAYGIACMGLARLMIVQGNFQQADNLLYDADGYLPKDHPGRAELEQNRAGTDEAMNRYDSAIARLRKCIELQPSKREEFVGAIAIIHLKNERLEQGLEVLAEVPDSRHPDVLSAHCYAARIRAKRDPESEAMDRALELYRATIAELPEDRIYRLVMEFAELVLDKVSPAQAASQRKLLEEAVALVERQVKLRAECPAGYWNLSRLFRLLGDAGKEAEFGRLHEQKTKEFEKGKERFDQHGRARC